MAPLTTTMAMTTTRATIKGMAASTTIEAMEEEDLQVRNTSRTTTTPGRMGPGGEGGRCPEEEEVPCGPRPAMLDEGGPTPLAAVATPTVLAGPELAAILRPGAVDGLLRPNDPQT